MKLIITILLATQIIHAVPIQKEVKVATQKQEPKVETKVDIVSKPVEPVKEAPKPTPEQVTPPAPITPQAAPTQPTGSHQDWMAQAGISSDQWQCADLLIQKESGWRVNAQNPSSSAYGIPQSLPGTKMASAGADWQTNPVTQLRWMLGYVNARYGNFCGAWNHSQAVNWY